MKAEGIFTYKPNLLHRGRFICFLLEIFVFTLEKKKELKSIFLVCSC